MKKGRELEKQVEGGGKERKKLLSAAGRAARLPFVESVAISHCSPLLPFPPSKQKIKKKTLLQNLFFNLCCDFNGCTVLIL